MPEVLGHEWCLHDKHGYEYDSDGSVNDYHVQLQHYKLFDKLFIDPYLKVNSALNINFQT